jgi:hypothetical protein
MAGDHIVKSTDAGNTWTALNLPPAAEFVAPPVIATAPTSTTVTEGDAGQTIVMRRPFDLSHPYAAEVTVHWRTVDVPGNPAFASSVDGDYAAASGTLVFQRGVTRQYANVVVNGDVLAEPDEVIDFELANATNATIGDSTGLGLAIIRDDDGG